MSGLGNGDSVSVLIKSLKHSKSTVRRSAAAALRNLGPDAQAALPCLTLALNDPDPETASTVTQALGQIGSSAVPALIEALVKRHKQVRREAARALGKLGSTARAAVPALQKTLTDPDLKVRMAAAQALGIMGPEAREAVPGLIEALKDTNLIFCRLAAQALSYIGPAALPSLLELLRKTNDKYVQREASWALRRLAGGDSSLAPIIAKKSILASPGGSLKVKAGKPSAKDVATMAVKIRPPDTPMTNETNPQE
jgi:HEAT repeat protein